MDDRSPKRRRVSGSPTDGESEQRRTPRRASYMSPTKASLARFNPALLKSPHLSKSPSRSYPRRTSPAADQADPTQAHVAAASGPGQHTLLAGNEDDRANQTDKLFDDLDLGHTNGQATNQAMNAAADPHPQDGASPPDAPDSSTDNDKAMAAKVAERDEIQQELSALKGSCRQLEQFLDNVRAGKAEPGLDKAAMEKLALLLDDEERTHGDGDARPMSSFLDSLLPFRNPVSVDTQDDDEDLDVPSHRPIELKDPLPCLKLFTSLGCSLHLDPPRTEKDPMDGVVTIQQQQLSIRDAKRLFSATVDIEVSSSSTAETPPRITRLSVPKLSGWTTGELRSWIKKRQEDRDLGCLTYGLGSYFDMSTKRAQVWTKCEQCYPRLCGRDAESGKENMDFDLTSKKSDRISWHVQLGRTSFILQNREALLRIEWVIEPDWTGEARSNVTARAAFAQEYNDVDGRKSLSKVPATFAGLVKDRGVHAAISAIVSVLFS